ncbi:hypothetical protein ES332_A05G323200v1 [Gossypium tomentosum]|uniref:Plastocyanin-like domain-containing protein n=1 Tax=Gossypium tomentosum TaxID=34277 RepID=A0A5D2QLQ2_GOSTO|nr:hypothetical protein ES332_A05G323200v1 [Gossypium tomentosum]
MAFSSNLNWIPLWSALLTVFVTRVNGIDIYLDWNVSLNDGLIPLLEDQQVVVINGMFPGPLINATTDDVVHVNVFNYMDEPLLFTWNGIQQRRNSWQDGVSGTNCPIKPIKNWTYVFQMKDQIGTFFYFPSINFLKASGGYGPIRVNNRDNVPAPFPQPEAEFDLLIGDWYSGDYKHFRKMLETEESAYDVTPDTILMNGMGPFIDSDSLWYETFTVEKGKTYRFRISNIGGTLSLNFRIQSHTMLLVETEGSYTNQITLNSLDVHVGQSYSVLVTADQNDADSTNLYINPKQLYFNRWNLTTGAARPNPQGSFSVSNIALSQTFILQSSRAEVNGQPRLVVNNVSYFTPDTPLKLADHLTNGTGVYELEEFPVQSVNFDTLYGTSVVSGNYRGWIELVFQNNMDDMDSWHLDGYSFFVVGFGNGHWTPDARNTYNTIDPVARSTTQVYPHGWTAVYAFLDNPGMWNLRSQTLKNWYLGLQLYIRVYDPDPNPAKERPPPENLLFCGLFEYQSLAPARHRHLNH